MRSLCGLVSLVSLCMLGLLLSSGCNRESEKLADHVAPSDALVPASESGSPAARHSLAEPPAVDLPKESYQPSPPGSLTFSRDIAPIVFENCSVCHRPGDAGPFSLLGYRDVKKHAKQIAEVTESRFMPPWQPAHGYAEYQGERRLSAQQIGMIGQWVAEGASRGDPADQPPTPQWTPGWQLGEPDLVVKLPTPYSLPRDGSDVFRNFVMPNVTASDRYVRALELRLDNPDVVHHAEFRLDESETSWRSDHEEPGPGFAGMDAPTAHYPDGHFVNWVPGKRASELPEGLSWRLPAGADLVVQIHMLPSGFEETVDPRIGLYFADAPPERNPQMLWLGSRWLPISAGDAGFVTRDSYELPVAVEVLSVLPHCHYVCKQIKAWVTLPDGSQQWLVRIEEWDFYWQDEFRFKQPLSLPRGTILSMEYGYDNSAENWSNPNDPPQDIEFGPLSSNEMADLWIQVMPGSERERRELRRHSFRHRNQKIIERQSHLVDVEPDVNSYIELARNYERALQPAEAVIQLEKALGLAPDSTAVLESLGIALMGQGQHDLGFAHLERLVELAPDDSRAHFNFAAALTFSKRIEQAESHLKRATVLDPSFEPAFFRLGRAQFYLGRFDEALVSYRAALALNSDGPAALSATARLLATHPDPSKRRPGEALELAKRALKHLPRPDARSLSTLAAAQAASGNFELATQTARRALKRVPPNEAKALGPRIQRQIDHFQQGRIGVAAAARDVAR